jgi:hypothetical protein
MSGGNAWRLEHGINGEVGERHRSMRDGSGDGWIWPRFQIHGFISRLRFFSI